MKVEKISRTNLPLDNYTPEKEQQRFASIRKIDQQKTGNERFRRESGVSKEDFIKQNERARRIGFEALLQDKISKINPNK